MVNVANKRIPAFHSNRWPQFSTIMHSLCGQIVYSLAPGIIDISRRTELSVGFGHINRFFRLGKCYRFARTVNTSRIYRAKFRTKMPPSPQCHVILTWAVFGSVVFARGKNQTKKNKRTGMDVISKTALWTM